MCQRKMHFSHSPPGHVGSSWDLFLSPALYSLQSNLPFFPFGIYKWRFWGVGLGFSLCNPLRIRPTGPASPPLEQFINSAHHFTAPQICSPRSVLGISSFPPRERHRYPLTALSVTKKSQERGQGLSNSLPGHFWGQFYFRGAQLKRDKINKHVKEIQTQAGGVPQKSLAHDHTQTFLSFPVPPVLGAIRF